MDESCDAMSLLVPLEGEAVLDMRLGMQQPQGQEQQPRRAPAQPPAAPALPFGLGSLVARKQQPPRPRKQIESEVERVDAGGEGKVKGHGRGAETKLPA